MDIKLYRDISLCIHLDTYLDTYEPHSQAAFEEYLKVLQILVRQLSKEEGSDLSQKALTFGQALIEMQAHPEQFGFSDNQESQEQFLSLFYRRLSARIESLKTFQKLEIHRYLELRKQAGDSPSTKQVFQYPSSWLRRILASNPPLPKGPDLKSLGHKNQAFRRLEQVMAAADTCISKSKSLKIFERFCLFMFDESALIDAFAKMTEKNLKRCLDLLIADPDAQISYRSSERFLHPNAQKLLAKNVISLSTLKGFTHDQFIKICDPIINSYLCKNKLSIKEALNLSPQERELLDREDMSKLLQQQPELMRRSFQLLRDIPVEKVSSKLQNEIRLVRLGMSLCGFILPYLLIGSWFVSLMIMVLAYLIADDLYLHFHRNESKPAATPSPSPQAEVSTAIAPPKDLYKHQDKSLISIVQARRIQGIEKLARQDESSTKAPRHAH